MEKIVLASSNKNKLKEIDEILQNSNTKVIPLSDTDFTGDIEETGDTFEENARIKAKAVSDGLGMIALADDSGLVIDALGGQPGVQSARFMGHDTPYEEKNKAILEKLKDVEKDKRSARFVCAMCAYFPGGRMIEVKETMEGEIAYEIAGENGFGYDPIFFLPQYGKTSAEISPEEKNAISHRGKALRKMAELLQQALSE